MPAKTKAHAHIGNGFSIEDEDGKVWTAEQVCAQAREIGRIIIQSGTTSGVLIIEGSSNIQQISTILYAISAGLPFALCGTGRLDRLIRALNADARFRDLPKARISISDDHCLSVNTVAVPSSKTSGSLGDTICIASTSGTTGLPKLVEIKQPGLSNALNGLYQVTHRQTWSGRVLQTNSTEFDGYLEELFATMYAGGTLVLGGARLLLRPSSLIEALQRREIDLIDLPTGAFNMLGHLLSRASPDLQTLRVTIVIGGQEYSEKAFRRLAKVVPMATIVNTYGPTEATITVAACVLDSERPESNQRIGMIYPGVEFQLVDDISIIQEPQPGTVGELVLGGCQLFGVPPDRLTVIGGKRYYRTSDLMKIGNDGSLEFLRRLGRVEKIAGRSVDLSDVESAIMEQFNYRSIASATPSDQLKELSISIEGELDSSELRSIREALNNNGLRDIPMHLKAAPSLPLSERGKETSL